MKKLLFLVLIILPSTYTSSAFADNNWYLGALYSTHDAYHDFDSAGVIVGYQYNNYFAFETRLGTGTSDFSRSSNTSKLFKFKHKEEIDTQISILLKASYPVFESLNVYALAGYTKTELDISGFWMSYDSDGNMTDNQQHSNSSSENGFSYGVGLSYLINDNFNLFVDYQALPDYKLYINGSQSWNSTTIGVSYLF